MNLFTKKLKGNCTNDHDTTFMHEILEKIDKITYLAECHDFFAKRVGVSSITEERVKIAEGDDRSSETSAPSAMRQDGFAASELRESRTLVCHVCNRFAILSDRDLRKINGMLLKIRQLLGGTCVPFKRC
jgi:hypothetical protein